MNEREFQQLFRDTLGEAQVPPDLRFTARRALGRPVERSTTALKAAAAVATIVLVATIGGYALLGRHVSAPGPAASVPTPPVTATSAPAPSPSPTGPLSCQVTGLALAKGASQGAAGHLFQTLLLTSTGSSPCTMSGYPTAQLVSASQGSLPTRVVDGGGMLGNTPPPSLITLFPGQAASFQVSWGDVQAGAAACETAGGIEVGPPGEAPSPALAVSGLSMNVCNAGELDVSAVTMAP